MEDFYQRKTKLLVRWILFESPSWRHRSISYRWETHRVRCFLHTKVKILPKRTKNKNSFLYTLRFHPLIFILGPWDVVQFKGLDTDVLYWLMLFSIVTERVKILRTLFLELKVIANSTNTNINNIRNEYRRSFI